MRATHIVFSRSTRGSLLQALGGGARVLVCGGEFHVGPLQMDLAERANWVVENYYDFANDELLKEVWEELKAFENACENEAEQLVLWFSRRCAREYCGYLEFLRLCGKPQRVFFVEMTDVKRTSGKLFLSTSLANPEPLYESLKGRVAFSDDVIARDRKIWSDLRIENAPLRILSDDRLLSKQLSYFDGELLALTSDKFQKVALVVGKALECLDMQQDYMQGNGDFFYFSRLKLLAEDGALEWAGSREVMRNAEVRRVQ